MRLKYTRVWNLKKRPDWLSGKVGPFFTDFAPFLFGRAIVKIQFPWQEKVITCQPLIKYDSVTRVLIWNRSRKKGLAVEIARKAIKSPRNDTINVKIPLSSPARKFIRDRFVPDFSIFSFFPSSPCVFVVRLFFTHSFTDPNRAKKHGLSIRNWQWHLKRGSRSFSTKYWFYRFHHAMKCPAKCTINENG